MTPLCSIKKYALGVSFFPLLTSSESFIISYDENPRPLIRLFDKTCCQMMCLYVPSYLVDMCYSDYFDSFIFLSTTCLYKLNPSVGKIELINDYNLLKENRSMSSICSTNDQRLFILYRFGEYLDTYPKGKRIWKRRHLCDSISEDISLIRSTKGKIDFTFSFLFSFNISIIIYQMIIQFFLVYLSLNGMMSGVLMFFHHHYINFIQVFVLMDGHVIHGFQNGLQKNIGLLEVNII